MNIFFILIIISSISLFSAFIFNDLTVVRTILIAALTVYLIELALQIKSDKKSICRISSQKVHNL